MALARYTFLPWLRRGAANAITAPAVGSRAVIDVTLSVNDGIADGAPIAKRFHLTGPGDIIGINRDVVVRTEPRAWVTDFEPNYLPFVDFYDEDFAWRHTPAPPADKRLLPWLTLLVLADGEFDLIRSPAQPLPSVRLKGISAKDCFPPEDQLWAWAHVQILGDVGGSATVPDPTTLADRLAAAPDRGVSRLLSARLFEQRRLEDLLDRQAQQLRDSQRRIDVPGVGTVEFNEGTGMPRRAFGPPITVAGATAEEKALTFMGTELAAFHMPVGELVLGKVAPAKRVTYVHFMPCLMPRPGDSDGGYSVMPGGLARVATGASTRIISMQRGGASKDTWVLQERAA